MAQSRNTCSPIAGELYIAGTTVPAGLYRLVGTNIKILMKQAGELPASQDGRMACYEPIPSAAERPPDRRTQQMRTIR